MKLAIVYDPDCPKLRPLAYSQTYRDMFLALCERYDEVQKITKPCSAKDIEADHIIFYDIHSSHHIDIDGIENHEAVKFEYFNDPHQHDFEGTYSNGQKVKKLGAMKRSKRANERGVKYVICPYENGYHKHIAPHFDGELLWFPVAPKPRLFNVPELKDRAHAVLANGHTWEGLNGFRPYEFRRWAFGRHGLSVAQHSIVSNTPNGNSYQDFLATFAGALALCDAYVVPKYLEIPISGCVCFAQYQFEYEKMGFVDGESCIYVTRKNFDDCIRSFTEDVEGYQAIADKGRQLILNEWTAKHFADFVYGTN